MGKIRRYKNSVEKFLSGEHGQWFFNICYSIGAAIVILGALFKILHLPGGNLLLCIGMGTEVLMFILTAFDRPPREYRWEDVFPVLETRNPDDKPDFSGSNNTVVVTGGTSSPIIGATATVATQATEAPAQAYAPQATQQMTDSAARAAAGIPAGIDLSEEDTRSLSESIAKMNAASEQLSQMAELTTATQQYLSRMSEIADAMEQLRATTQSLNAVSQTLLDSYRAITENSDGITSSSTGYVAQMEDLNRNIGGLNTIYEIQLKSVSSQLDSIDRVNRGIKDIRDMYEKSSAQSARYYEESEKMARYMQQLNQVYEKMIYAMTVNMAQAPIPGAQPAPAPQAPQTNPSATSTGA